MTKLRLAALALPLALALAGCSDEADTGGEAPQSEAIADIPAPEGQEWVDTAMVTPEGGVLAGNPQAPIKLVEYASHSCGACAQFAETAMEPLREYINSGRVAFEISNQIHDPIDLTFAVLARCAGPEAFHTLADQGWANLGSFFENAQANQAAYEAAVQQEGAQRFAGIAQATGMFDFFSQRGISRDQAMQCLADTDTPTQIAQRSQNQSEELGVTGTPTFFINGTKLDANSWPQVEAALQRAGAR